MLQALTHRSVHRRNNERLEFLGDAVLDSVISALLYAEKSEASEGQLSRLRSTLVRGGNLAALAETVDLGSHLMLGSGEKKAGGYRRHSILADATEAIIGAIFLDGGYAAAEATIRRLFGEQIDRLPDDVELRDPKTRLQELLQAQGHDLPEYEVVDVSGKPHQQSFVVQCRIVTLEVETSASGASRRKAEQGAATLALEILQSDQAPG